VAESTVGESVRERKQQLGLVRRKTFVPQSYVRGSEAPLTSRHLPDGLDKPYLDSPFDVPRDRLLGHRSVGDEQVDCFDRADLVCGNHGESPVVGYHNPSLGSIHHGGDERCLVLVEARQTLVRIDSIGADKGYVRGEPLHLFLEAGVVQERSIEQRLRPNAAACPEHKPCVFKIFQIPSGSDQRDA
jgi:hypothetical protein